MCAYDEKRLIGFVNVATDGGLHAFLLNTTVHPDHQHHGIGKQLVAEAIKLARAAGAEYLHVDFTPDLAHFYYEICGFARTDAGLMRLT
jgi:GNAT superfamily N-acetyltransferase